MTKNKKHMSWAERECRLACKKKNPNYDFDSDEFDYGCSCYKAALEVYNVFDNQGHSGMSYSITRSILLRLLNELPLTPIRDEDIDIECNDKESALASGKDYVIQCSRMSSLFKYVHPDGSVEYNDIDRGYYVDIENPTRSYGSNLKILNELFPIRMPYNPTVEKYEIYAQEFLCDEKNGDYDTRGIYYIITPKGERVEVNKFETTDENGEWKEITKEEYDYLLENKRIDRIEKKVAEHLLWTLISNSSATDEERNRREELWDDMSDEKKEELIGGLEELCKFFCNPDNCKYNTFSVGQCLCKGITDGFSDVPELVKICDYLIDVLSYLNSEQLK